MIQFPSRFSDGNSNRSTAATKKSHRIEVRRGDRGREEGDGWMAGMFCALGNLVRSNGAQAGAEQRVRLVLYDASRL